MQAALACRTKDEAEALVVSEIERMQAMAHYRRPEELRLIVKANIGYHSADYTREEAARLLDLFECEHPYFGKIEDWPKTPEETFKRGYERGQTMRRQSQRSLVSTGKEDRTL